MAFLLSDILNDIYMSAFLLETKILESARSGLKSSSFLLAWTMGL